MSGLLPREHGAYAQLGFPLLTGLIYARGHPGALGFAIAAIGLFLVHEPVAVLAGVRGKRLQEQLHATARNRVLALGAAAALGLAAAIALAPARAWIAAILPGGLALLLLPLLGTRKLKSLPAEVLVAAVFSTSLVPLALCGPATWTRAGVAATVWFAAVLPAIFSVHSIKVAFKGKAEGRWTLTAAPLSAAFVAVAAVAATLLLPPWSRDFLAVLPPALAVMALAAIRPHPRHLKRVGWTMVAADTLTLALLMAL
ncbi:MAG: YwiC-like family protein [Longimicrobiales bacterium]